MTGKITTEKEVVTTVLEAAPPIVVGGLVVLGTQLVSPRLVEMVELISKNVSPNGVATVIFRDDNYPQMEGEPVHAKFFTDSLSIAINVNRHINEIITHMEEKKTSAGLRCLYWETLLSSLAHEFFHAKTFLETPEEKKDTVLGSDGHEDAAYAFAQICLEDLAKAGHDVEPSKLEDDPVLSKEIETLVGLIEGEELEEDDWMLRQKMLIEKDLMFIDSEDVEHKSFKAFLRALADNPNDPAWDEPTVVAQDTEAAVILLPETTPKTAVVPEVVTEPDSLDTLIKAEVPIAAAPIETAPAVPEDTPPWEDEYTEAEFNIEDAVGEMLDAQSAGGEVQASAMVEAPAIPTITPAPPTVVTPPPPATTVAGAATTVAQPADQVYVPETWNNTGGSTVTQYNNTIPPATQQALTPVNLTVEHQRATVEQVFARLFHHLFSKCEFNKDLPNSFGHPEGVIEYAVSISDITGANELFIGQDFGDQAIGLTVDAPITDGVRGYITKTMRLPAYSVWINRGGVKKQFKLLPQSPSKTYPDGHQMAGQLKPSAVRVRQNGSAIAWIVEETPQGQMSNYMMAYEMDVGRPLSWRWMEQK